MIKKISLGIILLTISNVTLAVPDYLDCVISPGEKEKHFLVKLDESNGKITHTGANDYAFNAEGSFASNKITYKKVAVGPLTITHQYSINRSTLAIIEIFEAKVTDPSMAVTIPGKVIERNGVCKVAERKI